tara:strand:+ start:76801 stop:77010 length:210 start_codon:yes stop_codon:yes gene_type:complete
MKTLNKAEIKEINGGYDTCGAFESCYSVVDRAELLAVGLFIGYIAGVATMYEQHKDDLIVVPRHKTQWF